MATSPLISIVIPVRNEGRRLRQAILSFLQGRSRPLPIEFVIVDDASDDGCCEGICDLSTNGSPVKVIRLDNWSGIPFARNTGANHAEAPILFITDANVRAGWGWDSPLLRDIRPGTALCATITDLDSDWKGYGCQLDLPSMGVKWLKGPDIFGGLVPIMPCAGTVIYTDLFKKLGGYDTAMPVYGAAEPEFSVRLWLYGAEIRNVPDLLIHHHFKSPDERQPFLDRVGQVQMKNYLRFGLLYLEEEDIGDMLAYWEKADPANLGRGLRELDPTEIANRRSYLRACLPHSLTHFKNLFNHENHAQPTRSRVYPVL